MKTASRITHPALSQRSLWSVARYAALLAVSAAFAACGGGDAGAGGGGGPSSPQATAPTITAQPQAVSVTAGETAQFSVSADGTAPLSYQWRRNGVDIGGATASSYTTPATAVSDSGARFSVRVSNAQGSVVSGEAVLTVVAATSGPYGALRVSGTGVGSGYSYVPVGMLTSTNLHWYREPETQLVVTLYGGGTGISIVASPGTFGSYGVNFNCITNCDLAALGISVDVASRTLRFSNVTLPVVGSGTVTIDGTLSG